MWYGNYHECISGYKSIIHYTQKHTSWLHRRWSSFQVVFNTIGSWLSSIYLLSLKGKSHCLCRRPVHRLKCYLSFIMTPTAVALMPWQGWRSGGVKDRRITVHHANEIQWVREDHWNTPCAITHLKGRRFQLLDEMSKLSCILDKKRVLIKLRYALSITRNCDVCFVQ